MKKHSYSLYIVRFSGDREPILECEKSPRKVRNVALKIKQRPGRTIVITRDNKELPGGNRALDKEVYELWLEECETRRLQQETWDSFFDQGPELHSGVLAARGSESDGTL